jgi:ABC-2 type transport system ATP-binding protein
MEPVVVVESLTKRFRTGEKNGLFTAVDDVSFEVQRGEVFGLLGPNGAGKTTTIRLLLGLMRPTAGQITVLGYQLPGQAQALHTRTGYMSQIFTLYNDLTVMENVRFYGQAYGLAPARLRQRQTEIIGLAGLFGREHELTANLSGGWRQRLALGCAIVHEPELVFLDEPTAGVDPISRREFWELIYQLAEGGTTIFVTTHYMDEAELCQRIGFITRGRLVAAGTPDELKGSWMSGQVLEIDCDQPETAMRRLRDAVAVGEIKAHELAFYGAQLHLVVPNAAEARGPITNLLTAAGITVTRVDWIMPSLEDVFIANMR